MTAAPRAAPQAADGSRVAPRSALLSLSAGVVGLLSYACTLLMAHVLSAPEYSTYAAGQMLLGIVGIVAAALVPLPLVHIVRNHPRGSEGRRRGMAFAWSVSTAGGVVAATVTGAVTAAFAPPPIVGAVAASALALFAISPVWGWMQGELRFMRFAATTMAEVGIRLAFSIAAVLLGWGATGALTGFIAGATVVLVAGLGALYQDLAWRPRVITEKLRWTETGDIALTQLVIATLIGADVVLVALIGKGAPDAAGYQALATLAKGPVYLAVGTVLVAFPLLRSSNARVEDVLREALRCFARLAFPTVAVLATVPVGLALLMLPQRYAGSLAMMPWLAAAGLGYATLTVLATVMLALRAYRRSQLGLLVASFVLPAGLLLGWRIDGIHGLAVGCAVGALTAAVVLAVIAAPLLPSGTIWRAVIGLALAAVLLAVLQLVRPHPTLWLIAVAAAGAVVLRGMRQRRTECHSATSGVPTPYPRRMRILHLGFEDPAMPGAGGGSLRTHEINRRLADQDDVTVFVQRFPGWVDRTEDGVRYVHVGFGSGRTRLTRLLGYIAGLPLAVRHQAADLVVEDFFAPISTLGAPLWTGRPTIGVVQWLNAEDKARQYKLPFQFVERFGVRRHHRLIAVSDGVAERLRAMNPRLTVDVIGNGVAAEAFQPAPRLGENIVFIGRLETAQKGLDLLLEAWALACHNTPGQLIIAGQGPDGHRLRRLATDLGIAHRVQFIGWVSGRAKYELLASARIVAVPSRFETFGIVALEALATGTPVVAFDIPCLREVIPNGCGQRVAPFDVAAYSAALTARYLDHRWIAGASSHARAFAARFNWDITANQQRAVYAAAASAGLERSLRPSPKAGSGTDLPVTRVLHLGFEDPLMPGAGGGSQRTHEINRRLVADHLQVTVLTTRYPGCVDRVQDGVSYRHVGLGQGRTRLTRLLGYVLGLPTAVRADHTADLVVEDFFAPFSSMAAPLWTDRPTIGMVQWLHARDKARQYKLPFHLLERAGVRTHQRLIAVSGGTADRLRAMNPRAHIDVIGNGVDAALFQQQPQLGRDLLFVGRLEMGGKGLDLLVQAWASACNEVDAQLVIAGRGPDESKIRTMADRLGVSDRILFVGWVRGPEKHQLLSRSRLVVVPSRYETFGIVAVEALATATPVLAFDIPCLREVVPPGCGWRVHAFDVAAFAAHLTSLYPDSDRLLAAGWQGRIFAANYDWDVVARQQARVYRATVHEARATSTRTDPAPLPVRP